MNNPVIQGMTDSIPPFFNWPLEHRLDASPTRKTPENKRRWDNYTEAKVDVTQEIEQRAQQAAQGGADHYVMCSIHFSLSVMNDMLPFSEEHNEL